MPTGASVQSDSGRERRSLGFSTLEVLIALVVLSAGLLPLMDSQLQLQRLAVRLEQLDRENAALSGALRYMRDVNPGTRPTGEYFIGTSRLRWQSRLAANDAAFIMPLRGDRARSLGIFHVRMRLDLENGTALEQDLRIVGWSVQDGLGPQDPRR